MNPITLYLPLRHTFHRRWACVAGALILITGMVSCGGGGGGSSSHQASPATDGSLEVVNGSPTLDMTDCRISPSSDRTWGSNLLTGNLSHGGTLTVSHVTPGTYDLKAVWSDGSTSEQDAQSVLAGASPVFTLAPPPTPPDSIQIINNLSIPITRAYVALSSASQWGANQLSTPLAAGNSLILTGFTPGTYDCQVDTSDGASATFHAFTVSATTLEQLTVNAVAPMPVIASFGATPTTLTLGQSATLTWSVSGASTLELAAGSGTPAPVTGTGTQVAPSATTTYTLWATNAQGSSTSASTTVVVSETPVLASGTFIPTGSMTSPRSAHTATLLPNGQVLVAGGSNESGVLRSAELYNPTTRTFIPTGSMARVREWATATLLPNGRVLIVGFEDGAELYDPATGTFTTTGSPLVTRFSHTATLLANGKVLIVGGYGDAYLASAELYDPATGHFSATGSLAFARGYQTATLLPSGKVLIAGGFNGTFLTTGEVYDPATGLFTATGPMGTTIEAAVLLPTGKVLLTSQSNTGSLLYDPSTGGFTPSGARKNQQSTWDMNSLTLLDNGKVLEGNTFDTGYSIPSEVYDPITGTFTLAGSLSAVRGAAPTVTKLQDGNVLFAGGQDLINKSSVTGASAELFIP